MRGTNFIKVDTPHEQNFTMDGPAEFSGGRYSSSEDGKISIVIAKWQFKQQISTD